MARRKGGGTGRPDAGGKAGPALLSGNAVLDAGGDALGASLGEVIAGGKAKGGDPPSVCGSASVKTGTSSSPLVPGVMGAPEGGVGWVKTKLGGFMSSKYRFITVGIWRGDPGPRGAENAGRSCALKGDSPRSLLTLALDLMDPVDFLACLYEGNERAGDFIDAIGLPGGELGDPDFGGTNPLGGLPNSAAFESRRP